MMQLWIVILAITTVFGLFAAHKYHRKNTRKTMQVNGLKHIKNLRLVLSLLQKHRGLTSTFIKGDKSQLAVIQSTQQETNKTIQRILQTNQTILTNELWLSIMDHWKRLSENYVANNVDNNALQHNSLIQNMLYLIDDIAISHEVTQLKLQQVDNIRLIWKEWLTAIECIGQARAMGAAILAQGSCDSVARIRMAYLQDKINETSDKAWRGIPASDDQKKQVLKVVDCIKFDIIEPSIANNLTLPSSDYVSLCSEAMDSYYQQFDDYIKQL